MLANYLTKGWTGLYSHHQRVRTPVSAEPHRQSACQPARWAMGGEHLSVTSWCLILPLVCSGHTALFPELVQPAVPMETMPRWGQGQTPALVTHMERTHVATCRISCSGKLSGHSLFTQPVMLARKSTTMFIGTEREMVPPQRTVDQTSNACFPAINISSRDWGQEIDPKSQRRSC